MDEIELQFVTRSEDGYETNIHMADFAVIDIHGKVIEVDLPDDVCDAIQTLRQYSLKVMDEKIAYNIVDDE